MTRWMLALTGLVAFGWAAAGEPPGAGQARQAGIVEREALLHVSNVMLICNKCNRPVRVGFRILEDGKKVRVCRSCHEVIE